ncbi:hypothetical protein [Streptosporangium vulgare]|uniref:hypothetical protein n=1 Tax=Streptosporangium vulgare TaxID=46190 RepID=UPI0031DEEF50
MTFSPGLLGFLVVAGLGFALYVLVKSMRKQISRIEVPSEAELRGAERRRQPRRRPLPSPAGSAVLTGHRATRAQGRAPPTRNPGERARTIMADDIEVSDNPEALRFEIRL